MTPYERVWARMAGKPVDKVPNLNIAMALVAKCAGVSYREYAQNYKKLVEGNLYCMEHFGFDAVSAISDPMRETASFGTTITFPEDAVPHSTPALLQKDCDLSKLKIVSPYDNDRTLDRIRAVELFREKVGGEIPIIGWVEGVLAECADLRGVTELMYDLAEDEEYLPELMEIVHDRQKAFAKAQVDAGADIIGVGNAVASLIGPSLYEEYAMDYDKKIVEYIHSLGAKVKLHICGNITPLLPLLREVGPDILDIDWMVDYKSAVELVKDDPISICGNLDPVAVILSGTPEEVAEKTKACLAVGNTRSMIAGGCEVPGNTPFENLVVMDRQLYL